MSTHIYNTTKNTPYVYYLEWTDLNKKYIGCRYAKDCHPNDLFVTYFTSSKIVKNLLDNNIYPNIIKILSTHKTPEKALEEEKRLLLENKVVENEKFLNASYGAGENSFLNIAKKYGVDNVFQLEFVKEKIKQTNLKKYGVERPMQNENIKEKAKKTVNKKYEVDNVFQSDKVKEKAKQTLLKKYGVEYASQNEKVKEKVRQTSIERYGVDHYSKTDEYKEKVKQTNIEKYGVDNYSKTDEGKEKTKQARLNEKNECPFGCVTKSGNKFFNNGNLAQHLKSKHPEYKM